MRRPVVCAFVLCLVSPSVFTICIFNLVFIIVVLRLRFKLFVSLAMIIQQKRQKGIVHIYCVIEMSCLTIFSFQISMIGAEPAD